MSHGMVEVYVHFRAPYCFRPVGLPSVRGGIIL